MATVNIPTPENKIRLPYYQNTTGLAKLNLQEHETLNRFQPTKEEWAERMRLRHIQEMLDRSNARTEGERFKNKKLTEKEVENLTCLANSKYTPDRLREVLNIMVNTGYNFLENCIGTITTDEGRRVLGNQTFMLNSDNKTTPIGQVNKYGWLREEFNPNAPAGVMHQDVVSGVPFHAVLSVGDGKYNYANGSVGSLNYKKGVKYNFNGNDTPNQWRWVGTPEDNAQWEQERQNRKWFK